MSDTKATLNQRGIVYGTYHTGANLTQALYSILMQHYSNIHANDDVKPLPPFIAESLHMICGKMSRAINGDPFFIDSWRDISGYATLVAETLSMVEGATDVYTQRLKNEKGVWCVEGVAPTAEKEKEKEECVACDENITSTIEEAENIKLAEIARGE